MLKSWKPFKKKVRSKTKRHCVFNLIIDQLSGRCVALTMRHNNHLLLHYELFSSFRMINWNVATNCLNSQGKGRFFLLVNADSLHDQCSLFIFMMPNGMTTFVHGQFSIKREYYLIVYLHYNLLLRIIYHYFCVLLKFILSNRVNNKLIQTFYFV